MIKINAALYAEILQAFRYGNKEKGGIIVFDVSGTATDYYRDTTEGTETSYRPSDEIAQKIGNAVSNGKLFAVVHCHPRGNEASVLSLGDRDFAVSFLELNTQFSELYMALVLEKLIHFFVVDKNGNIKKLSRICTQSGYVYQ